MTALSRELVGLFLPPLVVSLWDAAWLCGCAPRTTGAGGRPGLRDGCSRRRSPSLLSPSLLQMTDGELGRTILNSIVAQGRLRGRSPGFRRPPGCPSSVTRPARGA